MTVAELIKALGDFPGDMLVGFGDNEYGWTEVDEVFPSVKYGWHYDINGDRQERTATEVVQLG